MARPTARVLALLELLQAGGTRTVADLAARLDVDERTVRRYVGHLLDLDVPVQSIRGRYGGYRLTPGYRMPPLMLTDEEALAVLLGLVAGRRAGLVGSSTAASVSAAAKLRRVLPEVLGRRLDAVLESTDVTALAGSVVPPGARVLLAVAEAARERRPVAMRYADRSGRGSDRTLFPYGIVTHSGRWYVTGADSTSGQVRTFRLDRIQGPTVLAGSFDVPTGFDPAASVLDALAQTPWTHSVSLRVRGTVEEVRARLPDGLATVRESGAEPGSSGSADGAAGEDTGWVRVALRAERLDWIPPLLAGLDRPLVIEHPPELRELVHGLAHRLDEYAGADPRTAAAGP